MKSEIRKDYLQDVYAVIAPGRAKRFTGGACPFCPESFNKHGAIVPFSAKHKVAVVKNLFPAFTPSNPKACGRQEIVIDTPEHDKHFHELSPAEIADVLKVYGERIAALKKDRKIRYLEVFKNSGIAAGASKTHEHTQIIGVEFVSPHLEDKTEKEHAYKAQTGRCAYCDIMKKEIKTGRRIYSDRNIFVFAPYASQHAYEARIFTRRHLDNVSMLTSTERSSLGKALKNITSAVSKLGVPYNFYMHERVNDPDQHFYIKITPRGAHWAGFELGTGLIINPVSPTDAAKYYRKFFER